MKKNYLTIILLIIIFCFALFVRIYHLGEMPSGFHKDEVMNTYFGRFILENGRDVYGNPWPLLYVDKFGDFPPVLPMYFSGLATYFFDFTVFAARFPAALIGALTIFLIYFLAQQLWKDRRISLISSLLIAILPWHFVLSRATAEGIIALPMAILGLIYLIKFIKQQKPLFLFLSTLFFFLTYFLYPSYRIFVPLLLLPIIFLFSFKKSLKLLFLGVLIFFIVLTGVIASTDWGKGRFDQTSLFSKRETFIKDKISILAQEEGINQVQEVKKYHNKYVVYIQEFIKQYLSYFSTQFLFISGGLPYRYVINNQGLLYITILPLFLFSLIFLKQGQSRFNFYLLYLLIISPLPASLTIDDVPNVHRTLFMIVPLILLSSFGFVTALNKLKKNKLKIPFSIFIFGALVVEFILFLHMYYKHLNPVKSFERGDTNKEVILSMTSEEKNYQQIYSHSFDVFPIYYLFFTKNVSSSLIGKIQHNLVINKIDKITFININCPSYQLREERLPKNILIVDREECNLNREFKIIKEFTRSDGTKSYRFLVPKSS